MNKLNEPVHKTVIVQNFYSKFSSMKYVLIPALLFCLTVHGQDTAKIKELYKQAMEYERNGDLNNAIKTQINLFNLDTHNYVSANVIAGLYGKAGKFVDEIVWAGISLKIEPGFSMAYINLGNAYAGLQDFANAEINYREALRTDSLSPYAYYSLGLIEENKNDLKAAISYYTKSVTVDSTFENGFYNLAAAYANLKDFNAANKYILKLLALNPHDKDAQEMHAHIKERLLKKK